MKVPTFRIHDTVKWTSKDDVGDYEHSGQVTVLDEQSVTLRTPLGTMTIPFTDGQFEKIKDFKVESLPAEATYVSTDRTPVAVTRKRESKAGTKLEKCIARYASLEDKSRKKVIEVFVKEFGMTPAGASTYANTCKTKYNAAQKLTVVQEPAKE